MPARSPSLYFYLFHIAAGLVSACVFSVACADDLPAGVENSPPPASSADDNVIDPKALETQGAVIGEITIKPQNVFDLSNPEEDRWLYRLANKLHIVTRPEVIESQLLFEKGDPWTVQRAEESERLLRSYRYLREARVRPVSIENGVVNLEVETIDVWTLTPDLVLSRKGGENRSGIGIEEDNLLGRGIHLGTSYESNVDRDTVRFEYDDRNFLYDHYRLGGGYSNSTDGAIKQFHFGKPFYALDRRRAGGIFLFDGEQVDSVYDRGEVVAEYRDRSFFRQVQAGFSKGLNNGWVRRYTAGIILDQHEFSDGDDPTLPLTVVPDNRDYLYPFFGVEMIEDKFETTVNFDQISITEDRLLGTWLNLRLGYSSKSVGSSASAWHYRGNYSKALIASKITSLTVAANFNGRWQDGDVENLQLSGIARFHRRIGDDQLFYVSLSGSFGQALDLDNPIYLGGEEGLRGYPLRYQVGESSALLTIEHRIYTDWFPFRLFNVGGAVFFDAGRVWGLNAVDAPELGILKDVGVGLRLGIPRASNGKVIHVDLAFPLDGEDDIDSLQINVEVKGSF